MEKERKLGKRLYMRARPEQRLFIRNGEVRPVERKLGKRLYLRNTRIKPVERKLGKRLYLRNTRIKPEWLIYTPLKQKAA